MQPPDPKIKAFADKLNKIVKDYQEGKVIDAGDMQKLQMELFNYIGGIDNKEMRLKSLVLLLNTSRENQKQLFRLG